MFEEGNWQILEPIMMVEVAVPEEYQGPIIGLITKRHGIITGLEGNNQWATIFAEV